MNYENKHQFTRCGASRLDGASIASSRKNGYRIRLSVSLFKFDVDPYTRKPSSLAPNVCRHIDHTSIGGIMVDWSSPAEIAHDGGTCITSHILCLQTRLRLQRLLPGSCTLYLEFICGFLSLWFVPSLIDDILQLGVCDFPRFRLSIFDGKEELSLAVGQWTPALDTFYLFVPSFFISPVDMSCFLR